MGTATLVGIEEWEVQLYHGHVAVKSGGGRLRGVRMSVGIDKSGATERFRASEYNTLKLTTILEQFMIVT